MSKTMIRLTMQNISDEVQAALAAPPSPDPVREAATALVREGESDPERERREELEVIAAGLYFGRPDARKQFDMYVEVYVNRPLRAEPVENAKTSGGENHD